MTQIECRFCRQPLTRSFTDLGLSPLANAYIRPERARSSERFYPLHAFVCDACLLVQLEAHESPENIFSDYAYFSSYSSSWLNHSETYSKQMIAALGLRPEQLVAEVASNDGYLLQYFSQAGCRVLGIEPAQNVAAVAQAKGVDTLAEFFTATLGRRLAAAGRQADLLIGNNVLAHVPDLNDFVSGLAAFLHPQGLLTMEFPHLLQLMRFNQFDTIYHEHFSYFSLHTVRQLFAAHGLVLCDAEALPTHGGSLRIHVRHPGAAAAGSERMQALLALEAEAGLLEPATYSRFQEQVRESKFAILTCLLELKARQKRIVGYGAPAKGNTLLNYCGIGSEFLDYTVDQNPVKQGCLLPGTRIPIFAPEQIRLTRPDYVLILPWNLKAEIRAQLSYIKDWGGQFLTLIPQPEVMAA